MMNRKRHKTSEVIDNDDKQAVGFAEDFQNGTKLAVVRPLCQ